MRKQSLCSRFLISASVLFSMGACTFIPMPSEKPKPERNYDCRHYTNFQKRNYLEKEKDSIEIDFLKDVFPKGILVDQNRNKYWLTDFYDMVEVYQIKYHWHGANLFSGIESFDSSEKGSFKVKIDKKFFGDILSPIDFQFINTKTNTRSNRMRLGYFGFWQNAKDFIYINSTDDISRVKNDTIVILNTDIDYDEYFRNKEEKGYLFPDFHRGVFLNPFNHVIKNLTYDPKRSEGNAFLFPYLDNTLLDSLRLENISFQSDSIECREFSAITTRSMNTVFSDITGDNIDFSGNCVYGMSFISNISYNCDFLDSTVNGRIENNYKDEKHVGYAGGLSTISFLYQYSFGERDPDSYTEEILKEVFTKEKALFSTISHNTINADITATDFAGGITAYTDYDDGSSIGPNEINGKLSPEPFLKESTKNYYLDLVKTW